MITFRKATADDVRPALDLAFKVFLQFEAETLEPEAKTRFKADIVENETAIQNWLQGKNSMFIASDAEKIIGVVGEKWGNGHINIVFVDSGYHRRGIATELMNRMVCDLKLRGFDRLTLFSSSYALPFYVQYGFVPTGVEVRSDGFTFTPMEYIPNEIWDVLDSKGVKTGRLHERGKPMPAGDYHLVVHVWKHNGRGEWLIDERAPRGTDTWGHKWETTGGSAVAGDDSLSAALRESKEELGIDLDPRKGELFRRIVYDSFLVDVWVFEHDCAIEEIRFQKGETCRAAWASADMIRGMMANGEFLGERFYWYFDEMEARRRAAT